MCLRAVYAHVSVVTWHVYGTFSCSFVQGVCEDVCDGYAKFMRLFAQRKLDRSTTIVKQQSENREPFHVTGIVRMSCIHCLNRFSFFDSVT